MKLDDTFHHITTLVVVASPTGHSQGTGFYYNELGPAVGDDPQQRQVEKTWLVTNRHVLLPKTDGKEAVPSTVAFHMRQIVNGSYQWEPVVLEQADVLERTRFHRDPDVDVAAVDVHDLVVNRVSSDQDYPQWCGVSREQFAGNNNIQVQASDDVIIIGYPRGFYDEVNLFPIVKSGIVASRWGVGFEGTRHFLIDAKLFPGSSGSLVLSKPVDIVVNGGRVLHANDKQFAFLGVFSGEPYELEPPVELDDLIVQRKRTYDVGIVWYADLVEEILQDGERLGTAD